MPNFENIGYNCLSYSLVVFEIFYGTFLPLNHIWHAAFYLYEQPQYKIPTSEYHSELIFWISDSYFKGAIWFLYKSSVFFEVVKATFTPKISTALYFCLGTLFV